MRAIMTSDFSAIDELLRQAGAGDAEVLAELFDRYRERPRGPRNRWPPSYWAS